VNVRTRLRLDPQAIAAAVSDETADATPGAQSKAQARADVARLAPRLEELQQRLYAEGHAGGDRRLLVLLQGMDASGKDGAIKNVIGVFNPSGVRVTAFGTPTEEELAHDFLWRIDRAVPPPGWIGAFNRSQYEDVLVVRVHDLVAPQEWERRYDLINAWEAAHVANGVTFVKVYLHISYAEQGRRLLARIDDPRKHWKVDPGDLQERKLWPAYREAYAAMLERCHTDVAPWYVVPADRKWYRDWALAHLVGETLEEMDPQWPARPELDLDALRKELEES
jgi:PPK2 family polyphosphate:nucleotide phosphotransferase